MDENKDISSRLVDKFLMSAIVLCLDNGVIAKDDTVEKIKEVIYSEKILNPDNMYIQITYIDSLKDSIELLLKHKAYDEAIILAMTCIEHMLNDFYGEYFERIIGMSNRKIDDLLKNSKLSEKIGTLYLVAFREQFPQQLEADILALNKKRNDFIHYKAPKIWLDEWDKTSKKDEETSKIALSSLELIENLEDFLSSNALYKNNQTAREIFEKIKASNN